MRVRTWARWMGGVLVVVLLRASVYGQPVTWTQTTGPEGGSVSTLFRTPSGALLATMGRTLLRSQDQGMTWQVGLTNAPVSEISVWMDGSLLAGTSFDGLYRSFNDGRTWQHADLGPPGTVTQQLVRSSSEGLFARTDLGAFHSVDGGTTWQEVNDAIGGENARYRLARLAVAPNGSTYAGTRPICCFGFDSATYRWDADSMHWDTLTGAGGVVNEFAFASDGTIYADSVSMSEYGDGGFFRSVAGGPWERVLGVGDVLSLLLQSGGTLYADRPRGVQLSMDQGMTWTDAGLDFLAVGALAFDDGDLFAGTQEDCFPAIDYPYCQAGFGVFRQPEGTDAWARLSVGAPAVSSWHQTAACRRMALCRPDQ